MHGGRHCACFARVLHPAGTSAIPPAIVAGGAPNAACVRGARISIS